VENSRKVGVLALAQPVVRLGLDDALSRQRPEWSLLHAATMNEVAGRLAVVDAHFLVVCFRLPGLGGSVGLRRLRTLRPTMRVAVLLPNEDPASIAVCRGVGVHGFIGLQRPFEQVVEAVTTVGSGALYAPPATAPDPASMLTPQQREVLRLVTEGLATQEIARRLGLGVGTVKTHLARAYARLGVRSRLQAVVKLGWSQRPLG
jgi:DNA-binding NarL/FixJ family response regulator